jgi:hypothetical protein
MSTNAAVIVWKECNRMVVIFKKQNIKREHYAVR